MELGDDLLSHGETPHYHWRWNVSLLSSRRDQVVPFRYGRQAIRFCLMCFHTPLKFFILGIDLFHLVYTYLDYLKLTCQLSHF